MLLACQKGSTVPEERRRALVVDDEPKILAVVEAYLARGGFAVSRAQTGKDALKAFEKDPPDLVILDLMLPDLPGEEVCRRIRQASRVPVIMLTAKTAERDIVQGLSLGADDYLAKPFSPRELMARVDAVLRRSAAGPLAPRLSFRDGGLLIDTEAREVRAGGTPVALTPREYRLLLVLASHPRRVFSREELVRRVFGEDYLGDARAIDAHVKNLRRKIEPDPRAPRYLLTSHGMGYRFCGEAP